MDADRRAHDGAVAASYAKFDTTRHIPFAGATAEGDGTSTGAGVIAGIGAVLHAGIVTLEPRIGLDWQGPTNLRMQSLSMLKVMHQPHKPH